MGDALAIYFEARVCAATDAPSFENGGITRSAMALCELCCKTLKEYGVQAKIACENNLVTPALEAVIEANTYLSGVGADNGGLAAAHSIYNGMTDFKEVNAMHGSCVAYRTITSINFRGCTKVREIEEVMEFCYSVGLPITLKEMGVTDRN